MEHIDSLVRGGGIDRSAIREGGGIACCGVVLALVARKEPP